MQSGDVPSKIQEVGRCVLTPPALRVAERRALCDPLTNVCHGCFQPIIPQSTGGLARRSAIWHKTNMRKSGKRTFSVIVERDEAGYYVASVPELKGCHTQARPLDKLMERVREAIALCLEVERDLPAPNEFIGVQRIAV